MRTLATSLTRTTLRRATLVAASLALVALAWPWRAGAVRASFVPPPLAREVRDLAVDCLASGTVRPEVAALSDEDFEAVATILGRLIAAYGQGDYGSFLALRAGDIADGSRQRAGDVEGLRDLGRALAIPPERMPQDWVAALGVFWEAYYERPAIARFVPERTRVELHGDGLGARSLESWERSFTALRDRLPGSWIRHELSLPHRRGLEQVARDAGPLRWLDLELAFETHEGGEARLVVRFVRDALLREWFLHDAASIYPKGDRSERHLIL